TTASFGGTEAGTRVHPGASSRTERDQDSAPPEIFQGFPSGVRISKISTSGQPATTWASTLWPLTRRATFGLVGGEGGPSRTGSGCGVGRGGSGSNPSVGCG